MSLVAADTPRRRILIAEDNYLMAEQVGELVRGCGYAVVGAAASVEAGLAMIARDSVDGAVLDVDLAGRPSFPMCRALAAKGIPFLFLSAYGPDTVVPAEFSDAPHLTKPFTPSHLEIALRRLVGQAPPVVAKPAGPAFGNRILDALDPAAKVVFAASLERIALHRGDVLDCPDQPVSHVYFPVDGLISIFAGPTPSTRIEVASIGSDGMTAPGVVLGDAMSHGHTVVQAAGSAWRIPTAPLLRLIEEAASLRHHMLRQVGAAFCQLADNACYSGRATIVERLARWLHQASERLDSRRLDLTHDVLAEILGVRRPSVTTGLQVLEGKHLIRSTRRTIVVLDPAGLANLARR
jgi:CRP-like cAMP-binding protein